ncbi:MAG: adenine deaminase [Eggerthellaceae bacterium]|nr:adenine deaminase [Eggerthellaceae bacterium]
MAPTLLTGGTIVDVLADRLERADVLMEDGVIRLVGSVSPDALPADTEVVDVTGKILCPGFIDGHIHIESTLMVPRELARVCAAHGTAAMVADPHEIANVAGVEGLRYMLETSRGLPVDIFFALPSCVPATPFDESGATLAAADLKPFYACPEVVALGEVRNVPGVLNEDADLMQKIRDAHAAGRVVNGHAPGVLGEDLRRYIDAGVNDDHECSTFEEAHQRVEAGMWVMIREGSAARNLEALLPLFDAGYNRRCLLVTDDKHADDLLADGHIDAIIRAAIRMGADPLVAIRMGTIQAARCFNLENLGAIAPGFAAHVVAVDDLEDFRVSAVWHAGEAVQVHLDAPNDFVNEPLPAAAHPADPELERTVRHTFNMDLLSPDDFLVNPDGRKRAACHVIVVHPGTLITDDTVRELDFATANGTAPELDVAKIAVCERHHRTGHIQL